MKSLMTAAATLLAGAMTYVCGQLVLKLIDPCVDLKKFIGRIAGDLDFYGNIVGQKAEKVEDGAELFRKHACELRERLNAILMYDYVGELVGMPPEKDIIEASRALFGHSNYLLESLMPKDQRPPPEFALHGWTMEIRKLLRIKPA
jgi:hypothetical protein